MSDAQLSFIGVALFFLFVFVSGHMLRHTGRPYSRLTLTTHKLIGVIAVIFLGMTVYDIHQQEPLSAAGMAATIATALFFTANIATGSLMSIKEMPDLVRALHRYTAFAIVLLTVGTLYLLSV